jgi:peptide deformylase
VSPQEVFMDEGCLSFPLLTLKVARPKEVFVEYQDYTGAVKNAKFVGITARCFLHELDHMNGIVYTSKTKPVALQFGMKKRNKLIKKMKLK